MEKITHEELAQIDGVVPVYCKSVKHVVGPIFLVQYKHCTSWVLTWSESAVAVDMLTMKTKPTKAQVEALIDQYVDGMADACRLPSGHAGLVLRDDA